MGYNITGQALMNIIDLDLLIHKVHRNLHLVEAKQIFCIIN